jgi:hypothetical protein
MFTSKYKLRSMKAYLSILLGILLMFTSCASSKKLMQHGNYDLLIEKSVKALIKDPTSEKDADLLDKSYILANDRDLERIKYLKMEGNPNSWDEILSLYASLKNRQTSVKRVTPLHIGGRSIQYEFIDYDAETIAAKRKAAEYFYTHGLKLMENKAKDSYRQAYIELNKANDYSGGSYPNLEHLIDEAHYLGMSRALISVVNKTIINLPDEFADGLVAVNASELNSQWVEFYTRNLEKDTQYDYYIDIILQSINITPDLVKDNDMIEKKTVENGFEYVLDARGNVMKDTSGNDIKVKKYKEIQCTVIESHQLKDCNIQGEIEFLSVNPKSLLKKQPIAAVTHFEHVSARAIGDIDALPPEKKKLIEIKAVPFPDDINMIIDCTEALKKSIDEAIHNNRRLIN